MCVTRHTAESTGIKALADLADPEMAAKFDSDNDGKGEVWIGAETWSSTFVERIRAGSYGYYETMTAVDAAVATDRPIVFYCYRPHHVFKLHDIAMLEEPQHDARTWHIVLPDQDPAWAKVSKAESAWGPSHFHVGYASALVDDNPDLVKFLDNIVLYTAEVTAMSYVIEVERKTPEEFAREWFAANQARVKEWSERAESRRKQGIGTNGAASYAAGARVPSWPGAALVVFGIATAAAIQTQIFDSVTRDWVDYNPRKAWSYYKAHGQVPADFRRQVVTFRTKEKPGTIIIDSNKHFLYLVQPGFKAIRYGIGVGREGFGWAGIVRVGRKAEWPVWTPPAEMIARDPKAAKYKDGMPGGPDNPLGARAMYLYEGSQDTIYHIHGTVEPWSIGLNISSGCIRMNNDDVTDLYERVEVGAKVIVLMQGAALYKGV